jgi:putative ABC transport system permease protein
VDSYGYDDTVPSLSNAATVLRKELPIKQIQSFRMLQSEVDGGSSSLSLTPLLAPGTVCPGSDSEGGIVMGETGSAGTEGGGPGPCPGPPTAGSIDFSQGELFDDGTAVQALTRGAVPADAAALKAGKAVTTYPELIWPDGAVHVTIDRWQANGEDTAPTPAVALPAVLAAPGDLSLNGVVYPLTAAPKLGVSLRSGGLIATPATLPSKDTEDQVNGLLRREAGVQMEVERGYVSQYGLGLLALLIAAAVISLIGTFTAVGLAAAETRADLSTLAAVGAGPGVRRRLAAAQAGVISGLGGVLGVASGILAGWVLIRMQQDWDVSYGAPNLWRLVLPWPYLVAVGLGIPLLAMTIGFLTTRSRLTVVRRLGQ